MIQLFDNIWPIQFRKLRNKRVWEEIRVEKTEKGINIPILLTHQRNLRNAMMQIRLQQIQEPQHLNLLVEMKTMEPKERWKFHSYEPSLTNTLQHQDRLKKYTNKNKKNEDLRKKRKIWN